MLRRSFGFASLLLASVLYPALTAGGKPVEIPVAPKETSLASKSQPVRIQCELKVFKVSDARLESAGVDLPENTRGNFRLDNADVPPLCAQLQTDKSTSLLHSPRLTLCNGQEATMQLGNLSIMLQPAQQDGKSFRVRLASTWPDYGVKYDRTVFISAGETAILLLGRRVTEGRNEFGPPVISKIPYLNRLVKNVGYGRVTEPVVVFLTPRVVGPSTATANGEESSEPPVNSSSGRVLILGLGASELGGSADCTPGVSSRQQNPPQASPSQKVDSPTVAVPPEVAARVRGTELPKRQPKAASCVAAGDFFYRESLAPERSPEEQKQRRETAKSAYEQALQINPRYAEAYRGLARVHAADRDHDRSVSALRAALQLTPEDANLWFELGMTHSKHKEWDPAIEALFYAVDLNKEERQYANVLGYCLARAGRFEESLACFTRVVGEAKARYNVARMMIHLGQTDQGRQQLQLSLKLDSSSEDAKELLAELDSGTTKTRQVIVPIEDQEPQH